MKRIIFFNYILLIITVFCVSCNDGFLERKPLDRISSEDAWKDPVLMEAYVNDAYSRMPNGFNNYNWLHSLCDEGGQRGRADYQTFYTQGPTSTNLVPFPFWEPYYGIINRSNNLLDHVKDQTFDATVQPRVNRMIGEMKFLRAYSYSKLIALFGGVPLITKQLQLNDDLLVPRNTYDECVDFIVRELDEAAALLDVSYTGSNIGKATRGAALSIKARVLLYHASPLNNTANDRSRWQKAADAAKAVIDMGVYNLYPNYKEMFTVNALFNVEQIWLRLFNNKVRVEHSLEQWFFPNGSAGYCQPYPIHNATEFFEMKATGLLPKDDPAFDPQNPYVGRDPRFYDCISYDGAPWQGREIETFLPGGLDSPQSPSEPQNASPGGYYARKFIDESIIRPTSSTCSNAAYPYIRYGEVLLNYAEAMFYLGNEDECRKYLNIIRDRPSVQMPHITETGSKLEERLRNERYVELYYEDHRFFDIRRWRIAMQAANVQADRISITKDPVTGKKTYEVVKLVDRVFLEHHHVLPIPQGEIDKNPNLQQNPGYY
ncbi:MAG: RagB/SusD family nutrient uptake outer membrane protein [Tannerella sp.]|jgi:hypothetical protein|nr:RagB/SusD family nutrient uptake outer membrane protein [Tannerella sp.]